MDEISEIYYTIWNFAGERENAGEPLMSLLKELARKNLIHQINKIFMTEKVGDYLLVNWLSNGLFTKYKLDELLNMLPKEYQDELRNVSVSFSSGDKNYSCPLIDDGLLITPQVLQQ